MEIGAIIIFIQIIILIIGFAALIKGADIFVDGSAALARRFKVSSIIIGLGVSPPLSASDYIGVSLPLNVSDYIRISPLQV